jgi:ribosomal protein S18 acetylase RimI-like enzyme
MQAGTLTSALDPTSLPEAVAAVQDRASAERRREVRELCEADCPIVTRLLAEDTLRGVHLLGMIEEHGINHPAHRGRFYGYFEDDCLRNVALLGHHILIYSEVGLEYLAAKAYEIAASGSLILGPTRQVEEFWSHLSAYGRQTRMLRPQYWMVCRETYLPMQKLQVQVASLDNLEEIVETQAELVRAQSGIDPRSRDAAGFHRRVRERIQRHRTFVKMQDGKVVFKAELVSETEDVAYLESIWTHPDYRGKGIATSCLNELMRRFLNGGKTIAILVEPEEETALCIYERIGFIYEEDYQARFLKPLAS